MAGSATAGPRAPRVGHGTSLPDPPSAVDVVCWHTEEAPLRRKPSPRPRFPCLFPGAPPVPRVWTLVLASPLTAHLGPPLPSSCASKSHLSSSSGSPAFTRRLLTLPCPRSWTRHREALVSFGRVGRVPSTPKWELGGDSCPLTG